MTEVISWTDKLNVIFGTQLKLFGLEVLINCGYKKHCIWLSRHKSLSTNQAKANLPMCSYGN
jgi:hypothetical protein